MCQSSTRANRGRDVHREMCTVADSSLHNELLKHQHCVVACICKAAGVKKNPAKEKPLIVGDGQGRQKVIMRSVKSWST